MKKIHFSNKYGLTNSVLKRRKKMTRRTSNGKPHYKIGEIIAIAQSYKEVGINFIQKENDEFGCYNFPTEQTAGWNNKLFVKAELMPHHIRIIDIKIERLQDISDDDCIKEGIDRWKAQGKIYYGFFDYVKNKFCRYRTPREAFAALIDRVSGKGTWNKNPYVAAYKFELID